MKIEESIWFDICYEDFEEVRKQIKNSNIDPNYEQDGTPLLVLTGSTMEVDIAEELIKRGGDVNICDEYGNTPIIKAISNYDMENYKDDSMIKPIIKKWC